MTIKKQSFERTVKFIGFVKGCSREDARQWLLDRNVIECDDVFLIMNSDMELEVKIWLIGTPETIEINL